MSPAATLPTSLDLSHHLNKRVKGLQPSAMKAMGRLLADKKGILSLGGGLPHPSLFPMQHASFTLPTLESIASGDVTAWATGVADTEQIHLKKTGPGTENDQGGILDLNDVLQYGLATGYKELLGQLEDLNRLLHGKNTADVGVFVTLGNTDGVSKAFRLLVHPGQDTILTEEYTFASSLASGRAIGADFHPIKTDDHGMIPEDLEQVLVTWNEDTQGKKPHLIYTIPCGQNPTGTIMPQSRYDEIYKIAQKHDLIIIEDDPYFPLQYTPYIQDKEERAKALAVSRSQMPPVSPDRQGEDDQEVARVFNDYAGVKSFLHRDVDGRVARIDTFSKVFGPGIRLGWITSNALFTERLTRIGETTTQTPNNLAQAILASYLSPEHWGVGGFIRWMWAVRLEYQIKRDHFLDIFNAHVPLDLVSTKACGGGMFQWLQVNIDKHPRFLRTETTDGGYTTNTQELAEELWSSLVNEHNVLVLPARLFLVEKPGVDQSDRLNFFRATFAGDIPEIEGALKAFGKGVEAFFRA